MQYTTKFKRLVSCLLVFVMLLGMIPFSLTTASAASTGPFELPVEGSTGYAVRDINIRATPSRPEQLIVLSAGKRATTSKYSSRMEPRDTPASPIR